MIHFLSEDEYDSTIINEATELVIKHQHASVSLLQINLELEYNKARMIIDHLEDIEIIGPFEGNKARRILVKEQ